jgi:quinoprotein glucose dehydrogenase
VKFSASIAAAALGLCIAQGHAAPEDWPAYGHDAGATRFSPLTQITPANVAQLQPAWTFHMNPNFDPKVGKSLGGSSTSTPLEVGGVIYLSTPYSRVVAVDATSGQQIWSYDLPQRDMPSWRGLAWWPGTKTAGPRIIFGTIGGRMIALDAKIGVPAAGFGDGGIVNLKTPEIMNGFPDAEYLVTAPPSIYHNVVIIGARVQERPTLGAAGDVRGFDALSGKLLWTFHSVPRPGEPHHDTWEGDSWRLRSGANVWNMMSVDEARGIVYLPFGAPTLDRYGGDHRGSNLYSDSLVAVNARSGKYLWHYQVVHHDIWDFDLDTPPTLVDVKQNGKVIPAVVAMNKTAIMFILNRITGKPIFPVTETPVPPSDVEGESAWPTQPIPSKPVQLARNSFSLDEIATVTPELKANCEAMIAQGHWKPSVAYQPITSDAPIIRFPGGEGGPEWAGGAFDPQLGLYVVNTNALGYVERLQRKNGAWANTGGGGHFVDRKTNMMCQQPPWGNLTAVNVSTGEIAWRVILGVSDQAPAGQQDTGRPSNGGPILTASGVTFIGGTDDARFRAFDTSTGKELWTYKLDYAAHATPITYLGKDGRQYVGVVATGGSYLNSPSGGDSLIMFALPKSK